jgi:SAM-dependent methyltransferase
MSEIITTLKLGKGIVRNVALGNSAVAALYQRHWAKQGYNPNKDQTEYPLSVYLKHATSLAHLRPGGFVDADVMEIGPGGNVGVGFLMLLAGAKSVVCLDVVPWIQGVGPDSLYPALVKAAVADPQTYLVAPALLERGKADPEGLARDLLSHVTYLCPEAIETTTLPDASCDIIFSQACFEHFPHPARAIDQIARLLRPGGIASHAVDLRDHRDFSRPLDFLRYPDTVWKLATSNWPSGVRNRWRAPEYRAAFEQRGMQVHSLEATEKTGVTEEMRRRFQPHFQAMSLEDLSIIGILIVAQKHA